MAGFLGGVSGLLAAPALAMHSKKVGKATIAGGLLGNLTERRSAKKQDRRSADIGGQKARKKADAVAAGKR